MNLVSLYLTKGILKMEPNSQAGGEKKQNPTAKEESCASPGNCCQVSLALSRHLLMNFGATGSQTWH